MQTTAGVEPVFNIYALSEQAVTVEFGGEINERILQRVTAFNIAVTQNPFLGFYTAVPAYTTLTIFFDPLQVILSDLPGANCFEKVSGYLTGLRNSEPDITIAETETITIPVCYDGDFGPDIDEVSNHSKLSITDIIKLHTESVYKVYMIGFVPGFAYLGGMDERLAMPRKQTPRPAVTAGSVGIAGLQTGIYPLETPGGWQIIGRTPLKMFDAQRPQPSLLKAGDLVVFKPIEREAFDHLANNSNADTDY
jgi:inhibitor of KinA